MAADGNIRTTRASIANADKPAGAVRGPIAAAGEAQMDPVAPVRSVPGIGKRHGAANAPARRGEAITSNEEFVRSLDLLLGHILGRKPRDGEVENWLRHIGEGLSAEAFVRRMVRSPAFLNVAKSQPHSPVGHYFSPIVEPDEVRDYVLELRKQPHTEIGGIDFNVSGMLRFWQENAELIAGTPFPAMPTPPFRYYFSEGPYPIGDAAILRALMHANRPRRIIEVGSGYSTACMVDVAEEAGLDDLTITCIEPNPARLKAMLRKGDWSRVTLVQKNVQKVELDIYRQLDRNDILFIDSTHILKTGSDVHHELFHILPQLRPGVLVHFHDIRYPFEYSDKQIFEKNYSWNEAYGVRALLMYSTRFKVEFYSSLFAELYSDLANQTYPEFVINFGSAIWLRVQDY